MLRALATRCVAAGRRGLASRVVNVGSVEAYDKLSTTGDLLVTNFTASWCGPCQPTAWTSNVGRHTPSTRDG